jgi:hypothetical protein
MSNLEKQLENLKGKFGELGDDVIEWLTEHTEEGYPVESVLKDLLEHGCQSGMVGHLIYYSDTHNFFDEHSDEILELLQEEIVEGLWPDDSLAQKFKDNDIKNFLAWLGFEETARKIANELELDI